MEILFFIDFLIYGAFKVSFLRTATLSVDDKINDATDAIELKAFPSRAAEIEQKKMRRRNLGDGNDYTVVKQMGGVIDFDDGDMERGEIIGANVL